MKLKDYSKTKVLVNFSLGKERKFVYCNYCEYNINDSVNGRAVMRNHLKQEHWQKIHPEAKE